MNEILLANLRALQSRDPVLVTRICWPVGDRHTVDVGGQTCLVYRGTPRPLRDPRGVPPAPREAGEPLALFGLGLGEAVVAALRGTVPVSVVVWERDPWLLRRFLSMHDLAAPLASGQLTLRLGCDLLDCAALPAGAWSPHPVLQSIYAHEWRMLERPRPELALVCEGGLFVDDLSDNLERAGHGVFGLDTQVLSIEEMAYTCHRLNPRLIAAINYKNGFAEFAASQGVPLLSWEIDPTTDHLPSVEGDAGQCFFFTYRRAQVEGLRRNGFGHAEYLPLASDEHRRFPVALSDGDVVRYRAGVSFVGSSMMTQAADWKQRLVDALASHGPGEAHASSARTRAEEQLEEIWRAQADDYACYRIPALIETLCPPLWSLAQASREGGDLVQWVAEVAAARKRLAYIHGLADFAPHVWGDEGWSTQPAPAGLHYRGRAGHGDELTRIYCASEINIDVNRLYQMDIVPMRVFDVLACGGFLLAEAGDAIVELFVVGEELVVYRDLDDLREKVAWYLARPEARLAIAARGRARVLRDHTIHARIQHMLRRAKLISGVDEAALPGEGGPSATAS